MMRHFNNPIYVTRLFFVLITTLIGYWVGRGHVPTMGVEFSIIALVISVVFVIVEIATNIISSKKILLASAGLFIGLVIAWFVYPTIPPSLLDPEGNVES